MILNNTTRSVKVKTNLSQTYKAFGGFKPSIVRALHFLIFYKSVEILTYAALFAATEKKSAKMSLTVKLEMNCYSFEVVKKLIYLGTAVRTDNDISLGIK